MQSWRQLPKLVGLNLLAASLVLGAAVADAGLTVRVSVASDGTQGDNFSFSPALSADGRFVAFESAADTLVAGNTDNTIDIFVHDRETGLTERVSVASDGTQGNGAGFFPALSADGLFVAFDSYAYNLVFGDTNAEADVFVRDRQGVVEVLCGRRAATIIGTPGDDRLVGTEGSDVIQALKGDDEADGRGGSDLLCGGTGDDLLDGGDGDDRLYGNEGDDTLDGGVGDDRLVGGYGDDFLRGGEGDDFLKGGGEDDGLEGGSGVDHCEAGQGRDTITDCEEVIDAP
jgi:Ca2+-binding RTX toxin-like protein